MAGETYGGERLIAEDAMLLRSVRKGAATPISGVEVGSPSPPCGFGGAQTMVHAGQRAEGQTDGIQPIK